MADTTLTVGARDIESVIEELAGALRLVESDDVDSWRSVADKLRWVASRSEQLAGEITDEADEYERLVAEQTCPDCGEERCERCGTCPNKCNDGSTIVMSCCGDEQAADEARERGWYEG